MGEAGGDDSSNGEIHPWGNGVSSQLLVQAQHSPGHWGCLGNASVNGNTFSCLILCALSAFQNKKASIMKIM